MAGILLAVAVLSFFFPLIRIQVPIFGEHDFSAYDLVARAREFEQTTARFGNQEADDSVSVPSAYERETLVPASPSAVPLSVETVRFIPIEIFASLACGFLAFVWYFFEARVLEGLFSLLGAVAGIASVIHITVANSDLHSWLQKGMSRPSATDAGPFAGLVQSLSSLALNAFQIKAGPGLYALAGSLSFAAILLSSQSKEDWELNDDAPLPHSRTKEAGLTSWLVTAAFLIVGVATIAILNSKHLMFRSPTRTPQAPVSATQLQTRHLISILKNLTYSLKTGDTVDVVKLTNGAAQVGTESYSLETDHIAFGDLDGDGKLDAVAVLGENGGGSGYFERLIAITDISGRPETSKERELGDRVVIRSISIRGGTVKVSLLTQGPDDGMCCPTQKRRFELFCEGIAFWMPEHRDETGGASKTDSESAF